MPDISVIIPIYKEKKEYFEQAIESVLNQSIKNIEILCIIDGAAPEITPLIETFCKSDKRIKFFKNSHKGPGKTRNFGIKKARGKYIAFMDSDDYYPSQDVLESLFSVAEETKIKVVGGKTLFESPAGLEPPHWFFKNYEKLFSDKAVQLKDYQLCWGYWCFIYEREFILKNRIYFPDYMRYQDPPWFLKALNKAGVFYAMDKVTYIHREQEGRNWLNSNRKVKDHFKGISDVLQYSAKNHLDDLHNFIYKKFLTNDENILKNIKTTFFISKAGIINHILKSIDPSIINKSDEELPYFKNYKDYKNRRSLYNLIDH